MYDQVDLGGKTKEVKVIEYPAHTATITLWTKNPFCMSFGLLVDICSWHKHTCLSSFNTDTSTMLQWLFKNRNDYILIIELPGECTLKNMLVLIMAMTYIEEKMHYTPMILLYYRCFDHTWSFSRQVPMAHLSISCNL